MTKKTESITVSGTIFSDLTGYEKYCIDATIQVPRNFTFKPETGLVSSFNRFVGMSYDNGDVHKGEQNSAEFNTYKKKYITDVETFIKNFEKKQQSILDLFYELDNPELFSKLNKEGQFKEFDSDRKKLDYEEALERYAKEKDSNVKNALDGI